MHVLLGSDEKTLGDKDPYVEPLLPKEPQQQQQQRQQQRERAEESEANKNHNNEMAVSTAEAMNDIADADDDVEWPVGPSSRAQFYLPSNSNNNNASKSSINHNDNDDNNKNNDVDDNGEHHRATCSLRYHRASSTIQIVVAVGDDDSDEQEQDEEGGNVVDAIDPRDVIGAELELQFRGNNNNDYSGEELSNRFATAAGMDRNEKDRDRTEGREETIQSRGEGKKKGVVGIDIDADGGGTLDEEGGTDNKSKRISKEGLDNNEGGDVAAPLSSAAADEAIMGCGSGDLLGPSLSDEVENLLATWDEVADCMVGKDPLSSENRCATAFLNIYCYPRQIPHSGGLWSWCTSKDGTKNNPSSPEQQQQRQAREEPVRQRKAHHRRLEVAPCEDFADARSIVRAIRRAARLGHFLDLHNSSNNDNDNAKAATAAATATTIPTTNTQNTTTTPLSPSPSSYQAMPSTVPPKNCRGQPKRYLVIVNPNGGTGKAETVYDDIVHPMLDQAGVDHDVCVTEYAGHAKDRMSMQLLKQQQEQGQQQQQAGGGGGGNSSVDKEKGGAEQKKENEEKMSDVSEYDAIIAMGGDGILWEILQGIHHRDDAKDILESVKFGIVGCGTSNGLAKSLLHACGEYYSALESTFLICKGQTTHVDLSRYEVASQKTYTGFLTFSWGLVADIDIESEYIRCLGSARMDIWAVWRMINLRKYRARFSYLPPSRVENYLTTPITMPPLNEPVPSDKWETIEDDFITLWGCQVSHASADVHSCPPSELQDGLFHVIVVRGSCSRFQLAKMFLKIESGGHIEHDECEIYDCVAFRLEPLGEGSFNDVDGEKVESGPIQGQVLPAAIQFFGRAKAT